MWSLTMRRGTLLESSIAPGGSFPAVTPTRMTLCYRDGFLQTDLRTDRASTAALVEPLGDRRGKDHVKPPRVRPQGKSVGLHAYQTDEALFLDDPRLASNSTATARRARTRTSAGTPGLSGSISRCNNSHPRPNVSASGAVLPRAIAPRRPPQTAGGQGWLPAVERAAACTTRER
jgi:hypothetical protein